MNKPSNRAIGDRGEELAVKYLKNHKFKVLERNYLTRYGEVDIIANDRGTIAFIEVKSRKAGAAVNPLYAVNRRKQMQIIKAAQDYIIKKKIKRTMFRFDVVTVIFTEPEHEIELIKDAFEFRELNQ